MASLTLKKMRRYNTRGIMFERGVVTPVEPHIALEVEEDPVQSERFVVKLSSDERLALSQRSSGERARDELDSEIRREPHIEPTENQTEKVLTEGEKLEAVRRAMDELDPDNEEHFTNAGKPDARALTQILGWNVTAALRDAALGTHPKDELAREGRTNPDIPAEDAGRSGRIRITRGAPTAAKQEAGEKAAKQAGVEGNGEGQDGEENEESAEEDDQSKSGAVEV